MPETTSFSESNQPLTRTYPRRLGDIALRIFNSEGKVGRLRQRYLEILAQREDNLIVQIGANDGIHGDPLYSFFQTHTGVRAALIEPQREAFEKLTVLHQDSPDVQTINMALAEAEGTVNLYRAITHNPNDPFGSILARTDRESLDRVMWRRPVKRLRGYRVVSETVPAASLSAILEKADVNPQEITAFFSDIEGQDTMAVQQLLDTQARPELIQWEHFLSPPDAVSVVNERLVDAGYQINWSYRDVLAICKSVLPSSG